MDNFIPIFIRSYSAWRYNFKQILLISAFWFVLTVLWQLLIVSGALGVSRMSMGGKTSVLILSIALNSFIACAVAVAWHRYFLLGETNRITSFKFGQKEISYLGFMLIIGFFWSLIFGGVLLLTSGVAGPASIFLSFIIICLLGPCFYRLSLVLPAAAIEEDFSFSDAWKVSDGLGWPMVLANIALMLPVFVAGLIATVLLMLLIKMTGLSLLIIPVSILHIAFPFVASLAFVTVLSSGYLLAKDRWFAGGDKKSS